MRDRFVPLCDYVHPAAPPDEPPAPAEPVAPTLAHDAREEEDAIEQALSAARRFKAALADALDARLERVLTDLAADVLGRELALAPADLAAIAARARERFGSGDPFVVRVRSDERAALAGLGVDVVVDDRLRRGDVTFDLCGERIDVSLGARLAAAIDAWTV